MKQSYVYILKCSDNTYYTGVTSNLTQRMFRHEVGYFPDCYTFKRRPLSLVFYCEFTDINLAFDTEKQIKKWSKAKKQALINGDYDKLVIWLRRILGKRFSINFYSTALHKNTRTDVCRGYSIIANKLACKAFTVNKLAI